MIWNVALVQEDAFCLWVSTVVTSPLFHIFKLWISVVKIKRQKMKFILFDRIQIDQSKKRLTEKAAASLTSDECSCAEWEHERSSIWCVPFIQKGTPPSRHRALLFHAPPTSQTAHQCHIHKHSMEYGYWLPWFFFHFGKIFSQYLFTKFAPYSTLNSFSRWNERLIKYGWRKMKFLSQRNCL